MLSLLAAVFSSSLSSHRCSLFSSGTVVILVGGEHILFLYDYVQEDGEPFRCLAPDLHQCCQPPPHPRAAVPLGELNERSAAAHFYTSLQLFFFFRVVFSATQTALISFLRRFLQFD
jgi:hypothetical protein